MKAPKEIYLPLIEFKDKEFNETNCNKLIVSKLPSIYSTIPFAKYLSQESVNEMLAEKDKIIEAKKNRIRILEKFIPKSDTNVVEDSSFKAIPTCKNCGNLFNDTDMKVIKSLPENVCSSCFTSNA